MNMMTKRRKNKSFCEVRPVREIPYWKYAEDRNDFIGAFRGVDALCWQASRRFLKAGD
jgi:hypothetical protein